MGGWTVLAEAAEACRAALRDRLVAAYALGSLAHGGFSPLVSDIDLGLVLSDPLVPSDPMTIKGVADAVMSRGSELHHRLSVFWGTPGTLGGSQVGGRFPAADRLDLLENGRLLVGNDARSGLARPAYNEILVEGAHFALEFLAGLPCRDRSRGQGMRSLALRAVECTERIRNPSVLLSGGVRELTKRVLFPVRLLYSSRTGLVATNQAAVADYLADRQGPSIRLVSCAFAWRNALPASESEAAELLREEMLPLYLHLIDDQIERLDRLQEAELVMGFQCWRDRLLD